MSLAFSLQQNAGCGLGGWGGVHLLGESCEHPPRSAALRLVSRVGAGSQDACAHLGVKSAALSGRERGRSSRAWLAALGRAEQKLEAVLPSPPGSVLQLRCLLSFGFPFQKTSLRVAAEQFSSPAHLLSLLSARRPLPSTGYCEGRRQRDAEHLPASQALRPRGHMQAPNPPPPLRASAKSISYQPRQHFPALE